MYIVGKTSDYYDGVMGLGIDKSVVYTRITSFASHPNKNAESQLYELLDSLPSSSVSNQETIRARVLLICGDVIPFVQVETNGKTHNFYSYDKIADFGRAGGMRLDKSRWYWRREGVNTWDGIKRFLENKKFSPLTKLHYTHKCPVILCKYSTKGESVILNPCLKDLGYQTQKDPYTLFQNIYMFISGVIGVNEKPMVKVSDKDLADKRGHGGDYSFRTAPGQGKGKRPK